MIDWIDRAIRLVDDATGVTPAPHVAGKVASFARGERRAIQEVASHLNDAQIRGMAMLPDPLPASPAVEAAVRPSLQALSQAGRRVLMVAAHAVLDRVDILLTAAAVDASVLLTGPVAGLLVFRDGRFRFADERLRAVMVAQLEFLPRREIHRSLARASAALAEPRLSAWHLVRGAAKTAPPVPSLLPLAERLLRAGDLYGAFEVANEIAARTDGQVRDDALLVAARAAFASGCFEEAAELLGRIERIASHDGRRAFAAIREGTESTREFAKRHERGEPYLESTELLARVVAAASAGATDAHAVERSRQVSETRDSDPEEADGMQAAAYLVAMSARPAWPWVLAPGPLSPYVEAYVRGQNIGIQMRHGDIGGAASLLEDAIGRLPLSYAISNQDAGAIRALIEALPGNHGELLQAFPASTTKAGTVPFKIPRLSRSSAAARMAPPRPQTMPSPMGSPASALTARQQEILAHVVEGRTNIEIGKFLDISPRTVEVHVTAMLRRVGARSRVELVTLALRAAPQ